MKIINVFFLVTIFLISIRCGEASDTGTSDSEENNSNLETIELLDESTQEITGYVIRGFTPEECQCSASDNPSQKHPIKVSVEGTYSNYKLWLDGTEISLEDGKFEHTAFQLNPDSLCVYMDLQLPNGEIKMTIEMNENKYTLSKRVIDNSIDSIQRNVSLKKWKMESSSKNDSDVVI